MKLMSYYKDLEEFITQQMRMSHIYQPVMLLQLLRNNGSADIDTIAQALLSHDESQRDYYRQITKNMVGKVLTKNRGVTVKDGDQYRLQRFSELDQREVDALAALCEAKIAQYKSDRGAAIWQHRTKSAGYISGTLRYEVLKRAKFRCELCGISAEEKALEADHIVPRNHGGKDDLSNLQSLCYSCNAMKRDRDDADFRDISEHYKVRDENCPFCTLTTARKVAENELDKINI